MSFVIYHLSFSFAQQSNYKLAGPYEVVARDGEFRKSKGGSERDMKAAWECAQQGQHEKALEIINACCHVYRSKNVLIDGLIINTCPIGASSNVTLHDVRSISHPQWGDGLNVFGGSSNILFDRVFCRNSDDCTTAYATRKGFSGSVRNVRMTNSTLWADVAHPIFIGLHGNPAVGDSIVNLRYDNIDIICQSEPQVDYQGCLAINCGDGNFAVVNVVNQKV